ncbi:MAG: hypothetical protein LQ346_000676 [Caloplaca aetnensis]|nr:MAG: hypothetical protein LQ346_000676 [Caloplaca aetnensis]
MLPLVNLSMVPLLLICYAFPTAGSPISEELPSGTRLALTPQTPANASTLLGTLLTNDWENFAQPIPFTQQILKGRILLSRPVRPRALHSMIEGGLAQSQIQIRQLGADTRLRIRDNPYKYGVPGCHFIIASKTRSNRPTMTYGMVRSVFLALEMVLEKSNRNFEASFVLTDVGQLTWGHGEVWERAPSSLVEES